jgi:DNA-binding GntR family transcriptional regulator
MNINIELNKLSDIPLYVQIKDAIKNAILDGRYLDQAKLPTEEILCSLYNISRPVVRRAYQALIDEGLVMRHQGKGTFVNRHMILSNLIFRKDCVDYLTQLHLNPSSRLMVIEKIHKTDFLPLVNEDVEKFYMIKRIRFANLIPIGFETHYIPLDSFEPFMDSLSESHDFASEYLNSFTNHAISQYTQMNVVEADEQLSTLFNIQKGDAIFKVAMAYRFKDTSLCLYKLAYYPGKHHQIDMKAD